MTSRDRLSAHRVSEMFVLDKTDYFVEVHLWPELQRLDPRGWLNNFRSDERSFANHLLNVFMFFNEAIRSGCGSRNSSRGTEPRGSTAGCRTPSRSVRSTRRCCSGRPGRRCWPQSSVPTDPG